jgi:hypothetical protein
MRDYLCGIYLSEGDKDLLDLFESSSSETLKLLTRPAYVTPNHRLNFYWI